MKMWQCAFFTLILIIIVWLFSYGIIKNQDLNQNAAIEVNIVQNNEEVKIIKDNDTKKSVFFRGKIKHHVPKVMLEFYENSKIGKHFGMGNRNPDIVRSIIPKHGGTLSSYFLQDELEGNHHMLVFNVPKANIDELFLKAELRVLTLIELKSKALFGLERQIKISFYNNTTNKLKFLEEKHIYHSNNTWITFNVSNVVQNILSETTNNINKILKFIITIKLFQKYKTDKTGVFKLSLMPIEENFEHDYPVLLLYYSSAKPNLKILDNGVRNDSSIRRKRFVEDDYEEGTNKLWDDDALSKVMSKKMRRIRTNCRRRPLYIDFAEIQYDTWIVQPSGYEAYQCSGKCFYPVAEHLSPTKHAIVQALLHSVSPSRAPRSCCVPTKLDSISVLYIDAQGVLTYRYAYKDMVVTDCGCR